jgi:hypothetical protein
MTSNYPTFVFTSLAVILSLGSWTLNPISAGIFTFADEFNFLGIPNGKNVLSCLCFIIVGIYGLTCRPRFDLGREVLVSMALACVCLVVMGSFGAWYHLDPTHLTRLAAHLSMALVVMNSAFALTSAQLPLKGRWWLFTASQLIAVMTAVYEYAYDDKRHLLMSEVFLILLILFSMIRVWKVSYSKHLTKCLVLFSIAFVCGWYDAEISSFSAYMISGHTAQHILWASAGLFLLRFLVAIKPSELNHPLLPKS